MEKLVVKFRIIFRRPILNCLSGQVRSSALGSGIIFYFGLWGNSPCFGKIIQKALYSNFWSFFLTHILDILEIFRNPTYHAVFITNHLFRPTRQTAIVVGLITSFLETRSVLPASRPVHFVEITFTQTLLVWLTKVRDLEWSITINHFL